MNQRPVAVSSFILRAGGAMSQDVMVRLAREVTADLDAKERIEGRSDAELAAMGLEAQEIASIRDGFLKRVLQLGLFLDDRPAREQGCCFE